MDYIINDVLEQMIFKLGSLYPGKLNFEKYCAISVLWFLLCIMYHEVEIEMFKDTQFCIEVIVFS